MVHSLLEKRCVERLASLKQHTQTRYVILAPALFEEPVLNRRQRNNTTDHALLRFDRFRLLRSHRQLGYGLMLKDLLRSQMQSGAMCPGNDLNSEHGVAAQFKEVVVDA